ncbi:hypothetical protein SDC9_186773 [bioreactor metagenome]|uniref:Uncharacterized protein n=1 Tax=bioreactor metagenome TaxID=1076179 RepID=A0A645HJQ6_9ZZZZ
MSKFLDAIKNNKEIIMTAGGIGATIAGVIIAKKSTLKCKEILNTHKENVVIIEEVFEVANEEEYNETDMENDLKINNAQTVISLAKTYSLPTIIILSGIFLTTNGIIKITKRRVYNE